MAGNDKLDCFGAGLFLLLPGLSRMFFVAQQKVQDERIKTELIEETVIEW